MTPLFKALLCPCLLRETPPPAHVHPACRQRTCRPCHISALSSGASPPIALTAQGRPSRGWKPPALLLLLSSPRNRKKNEDACGGVFRKQTSQGRQNEKSPEKEGGPDGTADRPIPIKNEHRIPRPPHPVFFYGSSTTPTAACCLWANKIIATRRKR